MTPDPITNLSSTGLPSRSTAVLAYSGWWVTGLILWFVERRDAYVRFHAAQAIALFGVIALLTVAFAGLAVASLSFVPTAFPLFIGAAAVTFACGLALWGVAMWKAASGATWRVPLASELADRMTGGRNRV